MKKDFTGGVKGKLLRITKLGGGEKVKKKNSKNNEELRTLRL